MKKHDLCRKVKILFICLSLVVIGGGISLGKTGTTAAVEFSRQAFKVLKRYGDEVGNVEFYKCNHLYWNPAFNLLFYGIAIYVEKANNEFCCK